MLLTHNESIFEALEVMKEEIEEIESDLDNALVELNYALDEEDVLLKEEWIKKAVCLLENAQSRLHKK